MASSTFIKINSIAKKNKNRNKFSRAWNEFKLLNAQYFRAMEMRRAAIQEELQSMVTEATPIEQQQKTAAAIIASTSSTAVTGGTSTTSTGTLVPRLILHRIATKSTSKTPREFRRCVVLLRRISIPPSIEAQIGKRKAEELTAKKIKRIRFGTSSLLFNETEIKNARIKIINLEIKETTDSGSITTYSTYKKNY